MFFPSLFNYLTNFFYTRQINAFLEWVDAAVVDSVTIFIYLPLQMRYVKINKNKKINHSRKHPDFIFCQREGLIRALQENGISNVGAKWRAIFTSSVLEIFERVDRYDYNTPLYFGLDVKQKRVVLELARKIIRTHLSGITVSSLNEKHLPFLTRNQEVDIDVGIWVKGSMRGSKIVRGCSLIDALTKGVIASLKDVRFKPVSILELKDIRIEITLLSTLRIPVTHTEMIDNIVYHNKSYYIESQTASGWFLPMVFNSSSFNNLTHLLRELKIKAGIKDDSKYSVHIVQTNNFIDGENEETLLLDGPIVINEKEGFYLTDKKIIDCANSAAYSILALQQEDGFIPIMASVRNLQSLTKNDLPRFVFSVYALATWAMYVKDDFLQSKLNKSFDHIYTCIEKCYGLECVDPLSLVYYLRLRLTLGKEVDEPLITKVRSVITNSPYDPILYLQYVWFFVEKGVNDFDKKEALQLVNIVLKDFLAQVERKAILETAKYSDLIPLLYIFYLKTKDVYLKNKYEYVAQWFEELQLQDGSFQSASNSKYAYARGTSKILESMSFVAGTPQRTICRAFNWLSQMQYREGNMFCINEDMRSIFLGGFRMDYFNTDVSIDIAAHMMIACRRLLLDGSGDTLHKP